MDKQAKNCEAIEDLNNTMNKFDLVTYFPELNKRKKVHSFHTHIEHEKKSTN